MLGASIIVVELPTAFPYFAAIAAILESGVAKPAQIGAVLLYNICFVVPLIGILAILITTGNRAQRILERHRDQLQTRWPAALAGLLLGAGVLVIAVASTGLASG